MPPENNLTAEDISKLLHDLRAPVSNARGFKSELNDAIKDLSNAIDSIGPELSDENRQQLTDIVADDIIVCAELLATSVDKLQERVQEFDLMFRKKGN